MKPKRAPEETWRDANDCPKRARFDSGTLDARRSHVAGDGATNEDAKMHGEICNATQPTAETVNPEPGLLDADNWEWLLAHSLESRPPLPPLRMCDGCGETHGLDDEALQLGCERWLPSPAAPRPWQEGKWVVLQPPHVAYGMCRVNMRWLDDTSSVQPRRSGLNRRDGHEVVCSTCTKQHKLALEEHAMEHKRLEEEERRQRVHKDCASCYRTLLAIQMRYCTFCGHRFCGNCARSRKLHLCKGSDVDEPVHELRIRDPEDPWGDNDD